MDNLLKQLINNAPDAILNSGQEGIIRFWDSGAEHMFCQTATEAVGQSLDLKIPENLRKCQRDGYSRVIASGGIGVRLIFYTRKRIY